MVKMQGIQVSRKDAKKKDKDAKNTGYKQRRKEKD